MRSLQDETGASAGHVEINTGNEKAILEGSTAKAAFVWRKTKVGLRILATERS